MGRKKKENYFNEEVEAAIHQFNITQEERERNKVFSIIYPALFKVAEVWYNKIKPTYVDLPSDEVMNDCIAFLVEKLPMIKEGKGKAFSYLTVTARNYYIILNQQGYKKRQKVQSIDNINKFDVEDIPSNRVGEMEANGLLFDTFIEYMQDNLETMFDGKNQKEFALCLLDKIKTFGLSEDFNRRKMLNDIAKETGIPRGVVTKHLNRVVSFYSNFKEYYEEYGIKPRFKEKLHLTKEDEEYIRKNYRHYSKHNGLNGISRKLGIKYEVVKDYVKTI